MMILILIIINSVISAFIPVSTKVSSSNAVNGIPEVISAAIERQKPKNSPSSIKTFSKAKSQILSPQQAFDFRLTCFSVSQELCANVWEGLKVAGAQIASTILIKKQILAIVNLGPYHDGNDYILASTDSNSFHYARNANGQLLSYPQALIKQAILGTNNVDLSQPDMTININSNIKFYFDHPSTRIEPEENDFQLVIIHEITHGLGMQSKLVFHNRTEPFLSPFIYYVSGYSFFSPPSVYDSMLIGASELIGQLAAKISTIEKKMVHPDEYLRMFEEDPNLLAIGKQLYAASNARNFKFHPKDADPLLMHNGFKYEPGSSYVHVKALRYQDTEVVMFPSCMRGLKLSNVRSLQRMPSVYGADSINLLQKMGYATRWQRNFPLLTIEPSFWTLSYSPSQARFIKNPALTEPRQMP